MTVIATPSPGPTSASEEASCVKIEIPFSATVDFQHKNEALTGDPVQEDNETPEAPTNRDNAQSEDHCLPISFGLLAIVTGAVVLVVSWKLQ